MNTINNRILTGERALFKCKDVTVDGCTFADGESPLKECRNIVVNNCDFKWKYPLWYGSNIRVTDCRLDETARAGIWYTRDINVERTVINAPKNFRRSFQITLEDVSFTNADETLWGCRQVTLSRVRARGGNYFAMNCEDITVDELDLVGDYAFDGAKNVTITNSKLLTKDAFWNSQNVTVRNSYIAGEYLGWNARNLTLIDCTVESLQGFCYIDNLTLVNCTLANTDRAFEYCTVQADVVGRVESIVNPTSGRITVDSVGKIILDDPDVDHSQTQIVYGKLDDE